MLRIRNSPTLLTLVVVTSIAGCARVPGPPMPTAPLVDTLTSEQTIEGIIRTVDPSATVIGGTSGGGGATTIATTFGSDIEASWSKTYTGLISSSVPLEDFHNAMKTAFRTELHRGGAESHGSGGGEGRAGEVLVRGTIHREYTVGRFRGDLLVVLVVDGASAQSGKAGYYLVVHVNEVYLGE